MTPLLSGPLRELGDTPPPITPPARSRARAAAVRASRPGEAREAVPSAGCMAPSRAARAGGVHLLPSRCDGGWLTGRRAPTREGALQMQRGGYPPLVRD